MNNARTELIGYANEQNMYEMPQTKKTNYTKLTPNTKLKTQETIQILAPTPRKGPAIKWFVIGQKRGQTGGKQKITLLANDTSSSVNNSRITVNVIIFAMLPAHGIWWETVSLLNVKCEHELANKWAHCSRKNASYITNCRRLTKTMRSYF